ncbi:MAG: hypothetical protein LAN61_11340 [Acidobacteriia bacterium]|nr:hypothetical protein [Terriglobia bacterium]
MSQREVKTPLAFYFRCLVAFTVVIGAGLYLVLPERRFEIFVIGICALSGLALLVAFLTTFKIKNLVYGEASHRAELRLGMGTEKKEMSIAELALTEGTEKPKILSDGGAA